MKVKCPACRRPTEWENNPHRPFCSERCRLIDLGAWASEKYRIKGKDEEEEDGGPSTKETTND
ncbi:MAG: DNA gyrase inhibitor YacG [Nitrospiraceae bacterium]|nr:MAG: DNA gyrase inhibitor YacG [Nitrospiraceae bacterium]